MKHEKAFVTSYRCGCRCGYIRPAASRDEATKFLLAHISNPETERWIGAKWEDHKDCHLEVWAGRWSACMDHTVYVDNRTKPATQEEVSRETLLFNM